MCCLLFFFVYSKKKTYIISNENLIDLNCNSNHTSPKTCVRVHRKLFEYYVSCSKTGRFKYNIFFVVVVGRVKKNWLGKYLRWLRACCNFKLKWKPRKQKKRLTFSFNLKNKTHNLIRFRNVAQNKSIYN